MQQGTVFGPRQVTQHGSKQLHYTTCSQNQSNLTQTALWEALLPMTSQKSARSGDKLPQEAPVTSLHPVPCHKHLLLWLKSSTTPKMHPKEGPERGRKVQEGLEEGRKVPSITKRTKRTETFAQKAEWPVWEEAGE